MAQTAWSNQAWVYRNPGGLVRDLKTHLEQLLPELEACIEHGAPLTGDLKDYVYTILETIEVDIISDDVAEEDLEIAKRYLADEIRNQQESIDRWGEDIRFPLSATPPAEPVVRTKMIDADLRQRVAPYIAGTLQPSLQGVLDHLRMVKSEMEDGDVWDSAVPRKQAIDAYLDATPIDDPLQQLSDDIYLVESLIAAWGDRWVN